jgi:predicted  nucleic acid-binding Zn-ribbon protein
MPGNATSTSPVTKVENLKALKKELKALQTELKALQTELKHNGKMIRAYERRIKETEIALLNPLATREDKLKTTKVIQNDEQCIKEAGIVLLTGWTREGKLEADIKAVFESLVQAKEAERPAKRARND